jgi:hypothetical protein
MITSGDSNQHDSSHDGVASRSLRLPCRLVTSEQLQPVGRGDEDLGPFLIETYPAATLG